MSSYNEYIEAIKEEREKFKNSVYNEERGDFVYNSEVIRYGNSICQSIKVFNNYYDSCEICALAKAIKNSPYSSDDEEHEEHEDACVHFLEDAKKEDKRLILIMYEKAIKIAERKRSG